MVEREGGEGGVVKREGGGRGEWWREKGEGGVVERRRRGSGKGEWWREGKRKMSTVLFYIHVPLSPSS